MTVAELVGIEGAREVPPEAWRTCWREIILPHLRTTGLEALAKALRERDPALIQGATCKAAWREEDPTHSYEEVETQGDPSIYGTGEVCQACAIGYAVWKGEGLRSRPEIEARFSQIDGANELSAEPYYEWFDSGAPEFVWPEMLAEVEANLASRGVRVPGPAGA